MMCRLSVRWLSTQFLVAICAVLISAPAVAAVNLRKASSIATRGAGNLTRSPRVKLRAPLGPSPVLRWVRLDPFLSECSVPGS